MALGLVWGEDGIQDTVIMPEPPAHNADFYSHTEYNKYIGISPALYYNYYLWKKRINIGAYAKARKYHKIYGILQYEYGLQLGFNF